MDPFQKVLGDLFGFHPFEDFAEPRWRRNNEKGIDMSWNHVTLKSLHELGTVFLVEVFHCDIFHVRNGCDPVPTLVYTNCQ